MCARTSHASRTVRDSSFHRTGDTSVDLASALHLAWCVAGLRRIHHTARVDRGKRETNVLVGGLAGKPGAPAGPRLVGPNALKYDIALSFAGEDRQLAREIAEQLQSQGVRVYFDEFERTELWGKDLSDEFRKRYGEETRYVVPLISKNYVVKDWTDFEFTIARREARRRTEVFILPVKLDDTALPGLRSSIAYLPLKDLGVGGIVEEILRKLRR